MTVAKISDAMHDAIMPLFARVDPAWDAESKDPMATIALDDVVIKDADHQAHIDRMREAARVSFNIVPSDDSDCHAMQLAMIGACETLKKVGIEPGKHIQLDGVAYYAAIGGALMKLIPILAAKPADEPMHSYLDRMLVQEPRKYYF